MRAADKKGVGGFFQLFDWNAKSRNKLFSSKSDLAEKSEQSKRYDGNSPMTRLYLMDEDGVAGSSSIKGSSDYSCASSVTDEDNWGTKAPGVVAKLMGLDSLPTCNSSEPYDTPYSDSHSLRDFNYLSGNLECNHDQIMLSGNLHKVEAPMRSMIDHKCQNPISRPIEKFQTEMLPPKSAKSIPITHHKVLSPIKSSSFSSSKDAAHIMEAAVRIFEPRPHITTKAKYALAGSSSVPLRLRDLREKAEASEKQAKHTEANQRPGESIAAKYLKGQPMNNSWSGCSVVPAPIQSSSESKEYSTGVKNQGKSVSLALQAKENVRRRGGLHSTGSKNVVGRKESSDAKSSQSFKSQPSNRRSLQNISSANNPSVLRQNNQKQNCSSEIGKPSSKQFTSNSQSRKGSGESTLLRQRSSNKGAGSSRIGPRRLATDVSNGRRDGPYSNTTNVSRKKRCLNEDFQLKRSLSSKNMSIDRIGSLIESKSLMNGQISGSEKCKKNVTDIVSFTFTAPMMRSIHGVETSRDSDCIDAADNQNNRLPFRPDVVSSSLGKTPYGSDDLSTLLEQKLRELNSISESSQQKERIAGTSTSTYPHFMSDLSTLNSSTTLPFEDRKLQETSSRGSSISSTYVQCIPLNGMDGETDSYHINYSAVAKLDSRLPSPVSVLEPSFFSKSYNSTDTVDSNCTVSNLCTPVQTQNFLRITSLKRLHPAEGDAELSDSASSTYERVVATKLITTSSMVNSWQSTNWELIYVKEILCHLDPLFEDLTRGRVQNIISPLVFDQLETQYEVESSCGFEPRLKRKILFDCVGECLDLRCRRYAGCGYSSWTKGLSVVRQKERLGEEVYREISRWSGMRNCMVDELVDKDMSSKFGRWDDYESEPFELGLQIENRLLNSLIDEVVADMLVL